MIDGHGAPVEVAGRWETLFEDMAVTAEELRAEGFDVVTVHAGDCTPLSDELAFDVLAPGDEFHELETLVQTGTQLEEFLVYANHEGRVTFALVVAQDPETETAACWPLYFTDGTAEKLGDRALEAGEITFKLRPLDASAAIELTLAEPELLFEAPERN